MGEIILYESIFSRYNRVFNSSVCSLYYEKSNFRFFENSSPSVQYSQDISLDSRNTYIIFNMTEFKEKANYLSEVRPKDSDCIIIDNKNSRIFIIEIKKTGGCSAQKQLESGRKWLEHIIFCSEDIGNDNEQEYTYYFVKLIGGGYRNKSVKQNFRYHNRTIVSKCNPVCLKSLNKFIMETTF